MEENENIKPSMVGSRSIKETVPEEDAPEEEEAPFEEE